MDQTSGVRTRGRTSPPARMIWPWWQTAGEVTAAAQTTWSAPSMGSAMVGARPAACQESFFGLKSRALRSKPGWLANPAQPEEGRGFARAVAAPPAHSAPRPSPPPRLRQKAQARAGGRTWRGVGIADPRARPQPRARPHGHRCRRQGGPCHCGWPPRHSPWVMASGVVGRHVSWVWRPVRPAPSPVATEMASKVVAP